MVVMGRIGLLGNRVGRSASRRSSGVNLENSPSTAMHDELALTFVRGYHTHVILIVTATQIDYFGYARERPSPGSKGEFRRGMASSHKR